MVDTVMKKSVYKSKADVCHFQFYCILSTTHAINHKKHFNVTKRHFNRYRNLLDMLLSPNIIYFRPNFPRSYLEMYYRLSFRFLFP